MTAPLANLQLNKLFHNISITLLQQLIALLLGLGLSVFIARTLGPKGNGLFAISLLLPTLMVAFLNLGIGPANVYFVSRGSISVRSAFGTNLRFCFILSALAIPLGSFLVLMYGDAIFPNVAPTLLLATLVIFPITLLQTFQISLLQGTQDFRRFNLIALVTPSVYFIFAFIMVFLLRLQVGGALLAYGLGQIVGLAVTFRALRTYLKQSASNPQMNYYAKQCLSYGWKAHLSNILAFVNYRADIYLVNLFLNPTATGVYVIAVSIAERLWMLSSAVSTVLLPRLSELHEDETSRRLLTPLISRWVLLGTLLVTVILALVARPLIDLFFGELFLGATDALLWLLPGIVLASFSRILANDLAARGYPEYNMYVSIVVVTLNVIGNILLIPLMGIKGAALATTIAYSVNAITVLCLYTYIAGNRWWQPVLMSFDDWELVKKVIVSIRSVKTR